MAGFLNIIGGCMKAIGGTSIVSGVAGFFFIATSETEAVYSVGLIVIGVAGWVAAFVIDKHQRRSIARSSVARLPPTVCPMCGSPVSGHECDNCGERFES